MDKVAHSAQTKDEGNCNNAYCQMSF